MPFKYGKTLCITTLKSKAPESEPDLSQLQTLKLILLSSCKLLMQMLNVLFNINKGESIKIFYLLTSD